MPKRKPNHHFIDAGTQAMVCRNCGSATPMPLGELTYACKVMDAWDKAHRDCQPGDKPRTWQSTPTVPVTTDQNREEASGA